MKSDTTGRFQKCYNRDKSVTTGHPSEMCSFRNHFLIKKTEKFALYSAQVFLLLIYKSENTAINLKVDFIHIYVFSSSPEFSFSLKSIYLSKQYISI